MIREKQIISLTFFALFISFAISPIPATAVPVHEETPIFLEEYVPMRDGIRLYTRIFIPDPDVWGSGPYPAIVSRTPYGIGVPGVIPKAWPSEPLHGYVYVRQDTRGRWYSEGVDRLFYNDGPDGYDTIEWVASQPWCNGKVGQSGGSALGITAYLAAGERPPHLVTSLAGGASANIYSDLVYDGGAFRFADAFLWILNNIDSLSSDHLTKVVPPSEWEYISEYQENCRDLKNDLESHMSLSYPNRPIDSEWFMHLPLRGLDSNFSTLQPWIEQILSHPSRDDFRDYLNAIDRINIPILHRGSWYDFFAKCTVDLFVALQNKIGNQKLFMRNGTHQEHWGPYNPYYAWFDYWLKGVDTGIMDESTVGYYCLGVDKWRWADQWPPKGVEYAEYYLHSGGVLRTDMPASGEKPESYVYDPRNPVLTWGGRNLVLPAGSFDQRSVEAGRDDILIYTTDVLSEGIEIAGPIKAVLSASSNCTDTDFTVKVIDVYPDGNAMLIIDNIIRARYRESMSQPVFMEPGQIYGFNFTLGDISHVFKAGHRIQVDISSSNFPKHDRNPNSGGVLYTETEEDILCAENTIYHDTEHLSYITLPVVHTHEDVTPPVIENISQQPPQDVVCQDKVEVYAHVFDRSSGVKKVTLSYTTGNGTWICVDMTNLEGNTWNVTIPTFPYYPMVTFIIIAEDKASNTITTEEMVFGCQFNCQDTCECILPLFLVATLLAVIVGKRKYCTQTSTRSTSENLATVSSITHKREIERTIRISSILFNRRIFPKTY